MGSNVLGDETYSLSVGVRASDQRQQAFNCIQYWLELFMLKTFASHTFLITAFAIQTKKNLGLETGCHSHRSFKACKSNMYAMNWPHKTLSLTSGRNSWGRNLWNLPSRQLRNISASVWEEPKKHATGNCHWNLWWFWRGKNFELKLVILVPVSFWAELYQHIHLSIFCVIFKGMRPVAGVLLDLTRRTMSFQQCFFVQKTYQGVSAFSQANYICLYEYFFFATGFSKRHPLLQRQLMGLRWKPGFIRTFGVGNPPSMWDFHTSHVWLPEGGGINLQVFGSGWGDGIIVSC